MSSFDLDTTKKWVEVFSAPAAIIALLFLGLQSCEMSEQNKSLEATIDQSDNQDIFEKTLDFDQVTLQDPLLYKAVTAKPGDAEARYLDESKADAERTAKADLLSIYIIDFYDYIFGKYPPSEYPEIGEPTPKGSDPHAFKAWSNALIGVFADGSFVCRTLKDHQESYGDPFISRLHKAKICPGLRVPSESF
ncbi:hypothetical protein RM704_20690 [Streptomyces sp. DSM 3412]|uniref:Secreted protein n=1 Tax=Streptomyces gottesmaniae TaxID=3075518 RepID=A0ABU2YZW6_9ACTN|nr:hypothetical protein [Streptomyces sp. DSM 3412]MDT0569857.1 hypothetical protein [Streptomyces sp. DSM 3412]